MPTLTLIRGNEAWSEYSIESPSLLIGRSESMCDLVLHTETVSRRHAEIVRDRDEYFLIDRDSRAGTLLNGRRLVKNIRYRLRQDDEIKICDFVLGFSSGSHGSDDSESSVQITERETASFSRSILDGSSSSWKRRARDNTAAKLTAIMEVTGHLRLSKDLEELYSNVLDSLLNLFGQAYRGIVVLTGAPIEIPVSRVVRYRQGETEDEAVIGAEVLSQVMAQQVSLLSDDQRTMCAPLIDGENRSLGVIRLDVHESSGNFTDGDLDLLATVAVEASIAVENWILQELALRDRDLQFEVKVANEVQIGLLPSSPQMAPGYDLFDHYSAARQVGGDYYECLPLTDHQVAFVLGDVSGKGVPAALLMAQMSGVFSVYLSSGLGPTEVVERANARFLDRSPTGRFITLIVAVLDFDTHRMRFVNAGHMPPMVRRKDGTIIEIGGEQSGLPLGVLDDQKYEEVEFSLGDGDVMLLYTDGVTEANNAAGDRFGTDRLRASLATSSQTATRVGADIVDDVYEFAGGQQQSDDICLVCLSRDAG